MDTPLHISLNWTDWLDLFQQHVVLSLLSIGGATSILPELHRFLVLQHHWLTETQFNASVAIAQVAPGPNVLFIGLLAWNVGINSGGVMIGFFGMLIAMLGILIPSTTLTYLVSDWVHHNRQLRSVNAFMHGMAPIVIALLIATGFIMASAHPLGEWQLWVVTIVSALVIWRTRIHMLWLIAAGALLGWFGII